MTSRRRDEVLVGLLLLFTILIGLGGTIWIARGGLSSGYTMYSRFPWGSGLKKGQAVQLAGIQIGFVDDVQLDSNGTIVVTMSLDKKHQIPLGTTASIKASGIFGDQLVALQPTRERTGYMKARDTIPVGPGTPQIDELFGKGDSIAANVVALTNEARAQFITEGGARELRQTLTQVTKLVAQLSAVTTAQSEQLTKTQEQLRRTLASIDSTKVDSSVRNVQAMTAGFEQLARELRDTNGKLQAVTDKISNGNGTVGRLMNDPAVYSRMDSLLAHMDSLVVDLKKNPRRYINLRIF